MKLSFAKAQPGRAVSGTCRQPGRSNRVKPRCTRYVTDGGFTVHARSGPNAIPFVGIVSQSKRLSPGVYRLTATPTDSAHHRGRPRVANLTITPN